MSEEAAALTPPWPGVARRLAPFFHLSFAVLLLAWLGRGLLGIRAYGDFILLLAFASLFIGQVLRVKTELGVARAVSSLLWNLAVFCILSIIFLWLLGWAASLEGEALPSLLRGQIPNLLLAAIGLGLGSVAIHQLAPARAMVRLERQPWLLPANLRIPLGRVALTTRGDNVLFAVSRFGRAIGGIGFGEVQLQLETPMGPTGVKIGGPYLLYGIAPRGRPAAEADVQRVAGRTLDGLRDEATRLLPQLSTRFRLKAEIVDMPFVHVADEGLWRVVDVGPVHVVEGPGGEEVRIGPFLVSRDAGPRLPRRWGIANAEGTAAVYSLNQLLEARWNGNRIRISGERMRWRAGGDEFEYAPHYIRTRSPLHLLHIGGRYALLSTGSLTIRVTPDRLVVRTGRETKALDLPEVAEELRAVLAEEAKRHIQNIMEGLPIELDSTLKQVERVLGKTLE